MSISLVNFSSESVQGGPQTTITSAAQNIANGNSIVVGFRWSATSVTDNAGNTYVPLPHLVGTPLSNLGEGYQFWYCNNCIGNAALQVTATLVSTSQALDTYTYMGVWNIAGGPLVLDQYLINGGSSGTTMTYGPFSTRYQNTIACLLFGSTANLNTCSVNSPLVQDGGSSLQGQQIGSAGHTIYTSMQNSGQTLVATTSVNGNWEIGGPIFGVANPILWKRRKLSALSGGLPAVRKFSYWITLERLR